MSDALVPYLDLQKMAQDVVQSGLFPGIKTPQQALTLFMVAQAEGLHPIQAMRRYHIIQGQVSLRTDTMLANFMQRGGTVEWKELTTEACEAIFTAPGLTKPLAYRWTLEDAARAGLAAKENWRKDPRSMLKARVISGGLRLADPASVVGLYAPEEVQDFEPKRLVADAEIMPPSPPQDLTGALEASIEAVKARKGCPPIEVEPGVTHQRAGKISYKAEGWDALKVGGKAEAPEPVGGESEPEVEPPYVPRYPGTRDGTQAAVDAVASGKAPNGAIVGSPERCAYCLEEGHDTPIGLYFSEQPGHEGEAYEQCSWAHAERERLEKKGKTRQEAQAAVSRHFRAWAKKAAK